MFMFTKFILHKENIFTRFAYLFSMTGGPTVVHCLEPTTTLIRACLYEATRADRRGHCR